MENNWADIVKRLLEENKELREELELVKSILHSNITILGEYCDLNENKTKGE